MIEILLFLGLGIILGIIMGLIPGIHPNMIILLLPVLLSLSIAPLSLLVFLVALGTTNTLVDFIPSFLLGAPDAGEELAVLPAHRLLMAGHGYEAVRLAVVGSVLASLLFVLLLPALFFLVPLAFVVAKNYIYLLLLFIVLLMILTEDGNKKFLALGVFLAAGLLGIVLGKLPVDETLVLFPVLGGFFGLSMLLLQLRQSSVLPKQREGKLFVSNKTISRSVVSGTVAGITAGFLPGVGSSELASLASVTKNEKSFLITMGALTTVNTIFALLCLWLLGKTRSGLAVALSQVTTIGPQEIFTVISVFLLCTGVAALFTLRFTKYFLRFAEKINYNHISVAIIFLIVFMTGLFTGLLGLLILVTCTAFGIFVNINNIKRGCLMGVLILPTILFYASV